MSEFPEGMVELKTTQETRDAVRSAAKELADCKAIPPERFPGHKGIACANLEGYLGRFAEALADDVDALVAAAPDYRKLAEELGEVRTHLLEHLVPVEHHWSREGNHLTIRVGGETAYDGEWSRPLQKLLDAYLFATLAKAAMDEVLARHEAALHVGEV